MNKKEIEERLMKNGVRRGVGQSAYGFSKELIFKDFPNHEEYEARIKIISNYLRI